MLHKNEKVVEFRFDYTGQDYTLSLIIIFTYYYVLMDKTKGRINMSDLIVRPRMLNLKGLMPVRVWVLFW